MMIFADKLIQLRKKAGWSQEELAEQMNVTRQSVSKWEGAQSIPDLEKIIRLSELFGVSTDYLLKDHIEEKESALSTDDAALEKRVSMEEANAFLSAKAASAKPIAYGVLLCILSPICLLLLAAVSETSGFVSEDMAGGLGIIVLLFFIASAVAIFISMDGKTACYEYLEKEIFETEYGVKGMVMERRKQYKQTYTKHNIIGACLCILSVIPIFAGVCMYGDNDLFLIGMVSITLVLVGIGVVFFVSSGIIWGSFETLLQEGDYTKQKKKIKSLLEHISSAYWLTTTAIFLTYSLITDNWEYSWIIWILAALLYPAMKHVIGILTDKNK